MNNFDAKKIFPGLIVAVLLVAIVFVISLGSDRNVEVYNKPSDYVSQYGEDDTNTEDEESSSFACTFEKFKITIAFDKYNETKVEIPSDVKENAVETGLELDF